ncbi:hypothetical protein IT893_07395 [Thalassospira sp. A40-3]|uniref:pyruvate kinase n=1 Tax=Thalassospira sp. A40-3 TaxID=2785908 RepID=UPI0018CE8CC8|nr:pyruvate kinase [Thalassospira sp. A40-3]QPO13322.1 hypothetical protein IT893_07395 [Thalassospira sp. A40-3]
MGDLFLGATIGPASWSEVCIRAMLANGLNLVRFPMSKETPSKHLENLRTVQVISSEFEGKVSTLADLPGGKPRLQNNEPIQICGNEMWCISLREEDEDLPSRKLALSQNVDVSRLMVGDSLIVGDGEAKFNVTRQEEGCLYGFFSKSFVLERKRSLTFRGSAVISSFTKVDKELAIFCVRSKFDMIAGSFCESKEDVLEIRRFVNGIAKKYKVPSPQVVAKIETIVGVSNVEEICQAADIVMVGRGDLSLSVGFENLFLAQSEITRACLKYDCPCLIATGFFESTLYSDVPNHSEFIDVSVCVNQGASGIVLSSASTIGRNPVECVSNLKSIVLANQ